MKSVLGLWNLCRGIACESRLRLLWLLFENSELCVSDAQALSGMSRPNTSNQLKAMHALGLISFRREKMNVIYRAEPVFPESAAARLLEALRACYERSVPFSKVIHDATAFSQGRRIELARAIGAQGGDFDLLQEKTGLSRATLFRQLDKLERRGVIRNDPGSYRLCPPDGILAKVLLDLAVSGPAEL
jgi:DNA-binding transcriptional ArsR family regulator